MSQSLARLYVHTIFSTKGREPWLASDTSADLHRYMAAVLNNLECPAIQVGGTADHVHILCALSKNLSIAKLIEEAKKPTSRWLKERGVAHGKFCWQNGYGAFSVSPSRVEAVKAYIVNQETHHREVGFQDEFRRFLKEYEIEYEERYVWD